MMIYNPVANFGTHPLALPIWLKLSEFFMLNSDSLGGGFPNFGGTKGKSVSFCEKSTLVCSIGMIQ